MPQANILVVEDDESLSDVLVYNLERDGYEVALARDGQEGLNRARLKCPDLVVLDLMLPQVDGLEVCRQLKSDPVTKNALILMLTAKAEETDQVVGFAMGADDYVTKPFSVRVLLHRIKALLRRNQDGPADKDLSHSQGVTIDRIRHRALAGEQVLNLTPQRVLFAGRDGSQSWSSILSIRADRCRSRRGRGGPRTNDRCAHPFPSQKAG